ncbi:hypothetical protein PHMEG_0007011 [Phytophthora megakarya]|uniref:Chromo domain-containing protein n=1 Tax=Phytophthora megakarya TaxID=4795 RepID=A0A225WMX0_9STRA|nr:hypothetical protein PHMEG_0007011 [Phytophthora megakarya]
MASLHNSFNINLLNPFKQTSLRFANRGVSKITPVLATDNKEPMYVIEKLVKRRIVNRKPEFLVKWVGLPKHENTWKGERDIQHASHWKQLARQLRNEQETSWSGGCRDRAKLVAFRLLCRQYRLGSRAVHPLAADAPCRRSAPLERSSSRDATREHTW